MPLELHPDWLRPSKIPLTIVCGPPCSGKSTYVNAMKRAGDIVIDLDAISLQLNPRFRPWRSRRYPKLLERAIRIRNLMLGKLATVSSGKAWFIVSAPTLQERVWWQTKLGGQIVLLNPGMEECRRRAYARGTPLAIAGIDRWEINSERPWQPQVYQRAIGSDGWPVAEGEDEVETEIEAELE